MSNSIFYLQHCSIDLPQLGPSRVRGGLVVSNVGCESGDPSSIATPLPYRLRTLGTSTTSVP